MLTTRSGDIIDINPAPFNKGGEGVLHEVKGRPDCLFKRYMDVNKAAGYENKILYMLRHKPSIDSRNMDNINWPMDAVYENQVFVGILLKKISAISELSPLMMFRIPNTKNYQALYHAFAYNSLHALEKRLTLCYNIAFAYHTLHRTGKYVVGDIKPQNILVNPDGTICLIDMDSIQISQQGKIIHYTQAITADYIPPENYYMNPGQRMLEVSWDLWSIAVIFYQVLLGIHPFMGTHPANSLNSLDYNIRQGLFAHALLPLPFSMLPAPHQGFYKLDEKLRSHFMQTFTVGVSTPSQRTGLVEWMHDLETSIKQQRVNPVIIHDFTNPSTTASKSVGSGNPTATQKTITIGTAVPKPTPLRQRNTTRAKKTQQKLPSGTSVVPPKRSGTRVSTTSGTKSFSRSRGSVTFTGKSSSLLFSGTKRKRGKSYPWIIGALLVIILFFLIRGKTGEVRQPEQENISAIADENSTDAISNEMPILSENLTFELVGGYRIQFYEGANVSKGTFEIMEITENKGKALLHVYSGWLASEYQYLEVTFVVEEGYIRTDKIGAMQIEIGSQPLSLRSADGNRLEYRLEGVFE